VMLFRTSGCCSRPSSSPTRSSPRTRGRCRAPAARSTDIRCPSGFVPTGPSKRSTSIAWRPGTATSSTRPSSRDARVFRVSGRAGLGRHPIGRPLSELVENDHARPLQGMGELRATATA
jgi:hypothetical protein